MDHNHAPKIHGSRTDKQVIIFRSSPVGDDLIKPDDLIKRTRCQSACPHFFSSDLMKLDMLEEVGE